MCERHREVSAVQHIAYFLGGRRVRSRPLLVWEVRNLPMLAIRLLLTRIIGGKCDRSSAVASQRPALIGKTIGAVVTENEMVE